MTKHPSYRARDQPQSSSASQHRKDKIMHKFEKRDNALIADIFELAAGKSISSLTLLEVPEFGNVDCTVTITAFRDGKQIGSMQTELVLHTAYLWPKEVQ